MTLAATSYPGFAQSGASSAARAEFDRIIAYINALEAAFINGTVTLLSKNVSGAGTVTLTAEEAGNNIIEFTGALAGAMNVVFPNGPLLVVVQNKTTGDFDLTCKTSAGTGVVVRRGSRVFIYPDGTNVVDVTPKTNSSIPKNLGIGFSVGGNALTIGLKDAGGSDPSVTSPVTIPFRSATLANGTQFDGVVTAALSVTVSSGSTVGSSSGVPQDIFVYALNNAGTVELAFSGADYGNSFIGSSTAEGGAGASDSATALYSTTARSTVAFTKIGRFTHSQTTAGTWAAVPTATYMGLAVNRRVGRELLFDSGNFSGVTSYDIPNVITPMYDVYEIDFLNILPATNNVELWARVSTDNGATYLTGTGYAHARFAGLSGGTSGASGSNADSKWVLSAALQNTLGHSLRVILRAQGGASSLRASMMHQMFAYLFGGDVATIGGSGWIDQQNVNAIRFLMSSGNISGRIRVYGVAQ